MDERSYNTPIFDKDKKYTECEDCGGEGRIMEARLYPSGHTEVFEMCLKCNGEGQIEIED